MERALQSMNKLLKTAVPVSVKLFMIAAAIYP